MSKIKLLFILIISITIVSFTGCNDNSNNDNIQANTTANVSDESENNDMIIETEKLELKYPTLWEDYLVVEQSHTSVDFIANVNDKTAVVFTMYFDNSGELYFGYILDNGTDTDISFSFNNFEDLDGDWNEEEKNILCSMQEDVNYLMDAIRNEKNFTEVTK